jgi:hypothetical protein
MNFKPMSEEQTAAMQVFAKGSYSFEIIEGEDKVSQAGNPMIELTVKVTDAKGVSRFVKDYLLEQWPVKLRHAAEACGVLEKYEAGELIAADFIGKTGQLTLTIEKDKTRKFPDKNAVTDYTVKEKGVAGIKFLRRRA